MQHRLEQFPGKRLIGLRFSMSFAGNTTADLWRSFMPRKKEIRNSIGSDLYSVQIYPPGFFRTFHPNQLFDKWAAVEVSETGLLPDGMEDLHIPSGLYAVFTYKGLPGDASPFFENIFRHWLPANAYQLDERPHFEVLGDKFNKDSKESEEEVWIPIRPF